MVFTVRPMKCSPRKIAALVLVATIFFGLPAPAQNLDQIGVTLLRAVTTNVNSRRGECGRSGSFWSAAVSRISWIKYQLRSASSVKDAQRDLSGGTGLFFNHCPS